MRTPRISIVYNTVEGKELYRLSLNTGKYNLPMGYISPESLHEYIDDYVSLGYDVFVQYEKDSKYIHVNTNVPY